MFQRNSKGILSHFRMMVIDFGGELNGERQWRQYRGIPLAESLTWMFVFQIVYLVGIRRKDWKMCSLEK